MAPPDPNDIAKQARACLELVRASVGAKNADLQFVYCRHSFLIAGYASLLEKHRGAAFGVALLGAWLTYRFRRLDTRSRQLVKAGERALAALEMQLAAATDINYLKMSRAWKSPRPAPPLIGT
jgi:hypothetical protein